MLLIGSKPRPTLPRKAVRVRHGLAHRHDGEWKPVVGCPGHVELTARPQGRSNSGPARARYYLPPSDFLASDLCFHALAVFSYRGSELQCSRSPCSAPARIHAVL